MTLAERVDKRTRTDPRRYATLSGAETLVRSRRGGPRAAPVAVPDRIGRYEVRGLLGEGAMGRVYRAYDPVWRREVAVKVIKEAFVRDATIMLRFRREAEVIGRLSHPGLVAVYDIGDDHIVLEVIEGESLAAILARRGTLPPGEALPILAAIAEALDHVHAQGIVHRDVKPSNVMVLPGGGVKVTDFGIARLAWAPVTRTGELLGSPAYMAPEQIARGKAVPASDIYALGVVAFEALTSRLPFEGRRLSDLLVRIAVEVPPLARTFEPAIPIQAEAVLARVLAKSRSARYPTARAFVEALEAAFPLGPSRP